MHFFHSGVDFLAMSNGCGLSSDFLGAFPYNGFSLKVKIEYYQGLILKNKKTFLNLKRNLSILLK